MYGIEELWMMYLASSISESVYLHSRKGKHNIDCSSHVTNKMLSTEYMSQFLEAVKDMLITIE